jgi:hypothetical protein
MSKKGTKREIPIPRGVAEIPILPIAPKPIMEDQFALILAAIEALEKKTNSRFDRMLDDTQRSSNDFQDKFDDFQDKFVNFLDLIGSQQAKMDSLLLKIDDVPPPNLVTENVARDKASVVPIVQSSQRLTSFANLDISEREIVMPHETISNDQESGGHRHAWDDLRPIFEDALPTPSSAPMYHDQQRLFVPNLDILGQEIDMANEPRSNDQRNDEHRLVWYNVKPILDDSIPPLSPVQIHHDLQKPFYPFTSQSLYGPPSLFAEIASRINSMECLLALNSLIVFPTKIFDPGTIFQGDHQALQDQSV